MCGVFPRIFAPSVKQLKQLNAALAAPNHLLSKQADNAQMTSCAHPVVTGHPARTTSQFETSQEPRRYFGVKSSGLSFQAA